MSVILKNATGVLINLWTGYWRRIATSLLPTFTREYRNGTSKIFSKQCDVYVATRDFQRGIDYFALFLPKTN